MRNTTTMVMANSLMRMSWLFKIAKSNGRKIKKSKKRSKESNPVI